MPRESMNSRPFLDVSALTAAALQSESVKNIQSERAELKRRVMDVEHKLRQEQQDHRDVTSGTGMAAA